MSLASKVRAGILLLDSTNPGWYNKINSERLDLGSCEWCVLGQLYGHFAWGLSENDAKRRDSKRFGFSLEFGSTDLTDRLKKWCVLTKLWAFAIEKRKAILAPEPILELEAACHTK